MTARALGTVTLLTLSTLGPASDGFGGTWLIQPPAASVSYYGHPGYGFQYYGYPAYSVVPQSYFFSVPCTSRPMVRSQPLPPAPKPKPSTKEPPREGAKKPQPRDKGPTITESRSPGTPGPSAAMDRCKVGFWNLTGKDIALKVAGREYRLTRDRAITLELERDFSWQLDGNEPAPVRIPLEQPFHEIILRPRAQ